MIEPIPTPLSKTKEAWVATPEVSGLGRWAGPHLVFPVTEERGRVRTSQSRRRRRRWRRGSSRRRASTYVSTVTIRPLSQPALLGRRALYHRCPGPVPSPEW